MNTQVLSVHSPELFQQAVLTAARLLSQGGLVALPTETVYGLAANALDEQAVARIYQVKGRPAHNPIIVHVAGLDMARSCAAAWPQRAGKLAAAFWPGPLTLVLPRAPKIPALVTAGGDTVGLRWPAHPFIQAVIRQCNFPLAAPSANLSNQISPTTAEHVRAHLDGRIPLIVDGGPSQVGIESTVLDLTAEPARLLRPGMVHAESLAAVGVPVAAGAAPGPAGALRSPGLLKKHYAPKARLVILTWQDDADFRSQLAARAGGSRKPQVVVHSRIPGGFPPAQVSLVPHDAPAYARALYAELHRCDAAGADLIVIEAPPDTPEWSGIADRLRRASA